MCGRYTLTREERELQEQLDVQGTLQFEPRFNVSPTQEVPVVILENEPCLRKLRWGLIPVWEKDASASSRLINARCETIAQKPTFRNLFARRRCLVPADGFYEWVKLRTQKLPVRICLENKGLFCFAGLWDRWRAPEGNEIESFTIITTEANSLLKPVHHRMPLILNRKDYNHWLDPSETRKERLQPLLRPFPSEEMMFYPVSRLINSPRNDSPECIEPIQGSELSQLLEAKQA